MIVPVQYVEATDIDIANAALAVEIAANARPGTMLVELLDAIPCAVALEEARSVFPDDWEMVEETTTGFAVGVTSHGSRIWVEFFSQHDNLAAFGWQVRAEPPIGSERPRRSCPVCSTPITAVAALDGQTPAMQRGDVLICSACASILFVSAPETLSHAFQRELALWPPAIVIPSIAASRAVRDELVDAPIAGDVPDAAAQRIGRRLLPPFEETAHGTQDSSKVNDK